MPITTPIRTMAALAAAATLAACADRYDDPYARDGYGEPVYDDRGGIVDDRGNIVRGAVRPTPDNPTGSVYVGDDRAYRCQEGLIFDC